MNTQAFNKIVKENHEKIYSLFRNMVKTHDTADDLTQETFIKVYKNLDKFKGESKMFTWIYRIAVNTGLNHLRKEKVKQVIGLENAKLPAADEKKELPDQAKDILQVAIKKLSPKQQMVVILRTYQEMSYKEIANIMNISLSTAKANYSHGIKNLKHKLEKMGVTHESL